MDPELDAFKTDIDLRLFAASLGYALDAKESWRASAVMRAGPDKVIIKRDTDGHYIYCSVRDPADNGTIIDFLQRRQRLSLGEVRKQLRRWIGAPPPLPAWPSLVISGKDRLQVDIAYAKTKPLVRSPYLESRGIGDIIGSVRFHNRIRIDHRANLIFRHDDQQGDLCGFEKKNQGYTGFAEGGEKGLWGSHDFPDDTRIVFAESAIDALSYAQLFPDPSARYRSFGGGLNPKQPELIAAHIRILLVGAEVVAAVDADTAGDDFATIIARQCSPMYLFRRHSPVEGDWNDVLKKTLPFPAARTAME